MLASEYEDHPLYLAGKKDGLREAAHLCELIRGPHQRNPDSHREGFEDACNQCAEAIEKAVTD